MPTQVTKQTKQSTPHTPLCSEWPTVITIFIHELKLKTQATESHSHIQQAHKQALIYVH